MKDARLNAPLMTSTDAVVEPVHHEEQPEWMKPKPYKTTVSNPYLRRSYPQALGMLRTLFVWVRDRADASLALPAPLSAAFDAARIYRGFVGRFQLINCSTGAAAALKGIKLTALNSYLLCALSFEPCRTRRCGAPFRKS